MLLRILMLVVLLGWSVLATTGHAATLAAVQVAEGQLPNKPEQPQLAVDDGGGIHLVYGVGQTICYRRSVDGGRQFDKPVTLPGSGVISLGMRRGPRIAIAGDAIVVSVIGGKTGKGRDGDVLVLRSDDQGKTWSSPSKVNDVADAAREGLHAMAAGPDGRVCCVWLDLRERGTTIMASESQDRGKTWGKNVLVYRSPSGTVCQCCHPSVVYDNTGKLSVLWRNALDGHRDMYLCSSTDGLTFTKAAKLGQGSWMLNACPMDGGNVAVTARGERFTTWRRDKQVLLTRDDSPQEQLLGNGVQPWLAALPAGPYVVWLDKRGGDLLLQAPGSTTAKKLASNANDPVIVANGKSGVVVAAWE
ncbi:MAG TPA: sialidase family protein, partial [Pirellulaceae bacterium]|nr:sialidase family protein [Pirellulaceae bacterium]